MNTTQLEALGVRVNPDGSIQVWAWNGWNSQWVESGLSAADLLSRVEEARAEGYEVIPADGLVIVKDEYDFYGWRESITIYTTHKGDIVLDEENNLIGDWFPA